MAINRYYGYNPLQRADHSFKLPMEFLGKTLEGLQEKSNQNYASLQQLPSLLHVNALEGADTTARNQVEQEYRDKIDNLVKQSNGDYSGVTKDIYGLKANLQKEMTTGRLGAIGNNYSQYSDYQKKMLDQKDLPRTYASMALRKTLDAYNEAGGYGGIDPVTGDYKRINPIYGQGYDYQGKLAKVGPFGDITKLTDHRDKQGNWYIDTEHKTGGVDYQRAFGSLMAEIDNDPLAAEHEMFLRKIGMRPEEIQQQKIGLARAEAMRRVKDIDETKKNYTFDPMVKINQDEEQFRKNYAQRERHHQDDKEPNAAAQITIGDQRTGAYPDRLSLTSGTYDKDGNPVTLYSSATSNSLNPTGGAFMFNGLKNSSSLTGNEPINFNHPLMKNQNDPVQKVNRTALNAVAMRFNIPGYNPAGTDEQKNQALNNWVKNSGQGKQLLSAVEEQASSLYQALNNKEVKGVAYNNLYAKDMTERVTRQAGSVRASNFSTGQKYGSLEEAAKTIGGDIYNTKGKKATTRFEVYTEDGGQPVATISHEGKSIKVKLDNVNEHAKGAYTEIKGMLDHKEGYDPKLGTYRTEQSGPMIAQDGSISNRAAIRTYSKGGQKQRYLNVENLDNLQEGAIFGEGVKYLGVDPNNQSKVNIQHPNGKVESMYVLPQDELIRLEDKNNPYLGGYSRKATRDKATN